MAVVEKNGRWFPVGKNGKPWKSSFPSQTKAKAALIKADAYWASRGAITSPGAAPGTSEAAPPAEEERGLKTLARMRGLQDEEGFN